MRATLPLLLPIVVALATLATAPPAQSAPATPITIVTSFYGAVNARQLDRAMTFVADNALFVWAGVGTYSGKARVRALLQDTFRRGWTWKGTNFPDKGGRVTYAFELYEGGGTLIYSADDGVTIVKAVKIVFDGTEATAPR